MGENLFNKAHKASNSLSRKGWDRTFGKKHKDKRADERKKAGGK